MNWKKLSSSLFVTVGGLMIVAGSLAVADETKKAPSVPEMKLPPGWTQQDMQACIQAGTPGKMHEHLAKGVGVWSGKTTMWMGPGGEAMKSDCTSTVSPMLDGHYFKSELAGEMPGMGPYNGFGVYGFDNVVGKFVSTWIDNHGTGIMNGTGELSQDGKVLTWSYTFNCPVTKKPTKMREIETITGPNTRTLEMWSVEPKSGQEYKMMFIELTKK
jgi:hypothetical protein